MRCVDSGGWEQAQTPGLGSAGPGVRDVRRARGFWRVGVGTGPNKIWTLGRGPRCESVIILSLWQARLSPPPAEGHPPSPRGSGQPGWERLCSEVSFLLPRSHPVLPPLRRGFHHAVPQMPCLRSLLPRDLPGEPRQKQWDPSSAPSHSAPGPDQLRGFHWGVS